MSRFPNGAQRSEWLALDLKKERKARAVPVTLDPPYPYVWRSFDPEYFRLKANPEDR